MMNTGKEHIVDELGVLAPSKVQVGRVQVSQVCGDRLTCRVVARCARARSACPLQKRR
jgi:hypothetical protein